MSQSLTPRLIRISDDDSRVTESPAATPNEDVAEESAEETSEEQQALPEETSEEVAEELAEPSPQVSSPPSECPVAAAGLSAEAGNNEVTLSWSPGELPVDDDRYTDPVAYYVSVTGPESKVLRTTETTLAVLGLRNGVDYSFEVFAATPAGRSAPVGPVSATPTTGMEGVVAGLIVEFADGVDPQAGATDVPGQERVAEVDLVVAEKVADDAVLVELSEPVDLDTAQKIAADLAADDQVEWAEPDQFFFTSSEDFAQTVSVPTDNQYASSQWNLWDSFGISVGDGSSEMTDAWAGPRGDGVTVAVIDTGITAHPDLDPQLVNGYDFVSNPEQLASSRQGNAPPVAFDGDYVDEATYGALGRDANPTDPGDWRGVTPLREASWHGTKIAGLIAAASNADGITGIAPAAKIQPIRALSWRGGLLSDIAASINWASGGVIDGVPANTNPSKVINMSFAVEAMCPVSLQQAIDGALERGSILVAAAGNASDDAAKYAPGNCNGVITVAATNRDGNRADYSNYGTTIDIAAPGGDSANPVTTTSNSGAQAPEQPITATDSGTSIAAAHVSAAAAILLSRNASLTPIEAYAQLSGNEFTKAFNNEVCDSINPDYSCGTGILSLAQIASFTPWSTNCTGWAQATSGTTRYIAFKDVQDCWWSPGSGITFVEYLVVGGGGAGGVGRGGGGGAGGVVPGSSIVSNTNFFVRVGFGGGSVRNDLRGNNGGPSQFGSAIANGGGGGGGHQHFSGVGADGGSGGGGAGINSVGTNNPGPAGGWGTSGQGSNGGRAAPGDGWGGSATGGGGGGAGALGGDGWDWRPTADRFSYWQGGPGGAGVAGWLPSGLQSTLAVGQVSGSNVFFGGGGGGGALSGRIGGGQGVGGGGTGCATTDCDNRASGSGWANTGGGGGGTEGYWGWSGNGGSGVVIIRFSTAPGAPMGVTATAGQTNATVNWSAPSYSGTSSITSYTVTSSGGHQCTPVPATATSCTVNGLAAGTPYTFTVTATNSQGTGPASSTSNSVTPYGAPHTYAVTLSSTTPAVGTPITATAQLRDSGGRNVPLASRTITWSTSAVGGSFSSATSTTNSSGIATVTYTVSASAGGSGTITATDNGSISGTSPTFTVSATAPGVPTAVTGTAGQSQATVTWSAPSNTGGLPVSGYSVTQSDTAGGTYSSVSAGTCATASTSTALSCTVTGLTPGQSYYFKVAALNSFATGSASTATSLVVPFGALNRFAVTTTGGGAIGNQAAGTPFDIRVTAQDSGGRTVTSFTGTVDITSTATIGSGGGTTGSFTNGVLSSRSITLTTAGVGQTITATETGGLVSGTSASFAVTATAPGQPTDVTAVVGEGQATVSWTAPANTGGSPITSYTVTASPGGATCTPSPLDATSCVIAGLTPGTPYTFSVTASNATATGSASTPSSSVVPYGALAKFAVTDTSGNPLGPQTAGTSFTIMITAQDSAGRTYTDFTGTVNITSNSSISFGGGQTQTFTSGVLPARSVILTTAGAGRTITATQTVGAVTGTSAAFTVAASSTVSSLSRLSTGSQTVMMGSAVADPMRVEAKDSFGNPVPNAPITFTVTAGGGFLGAAPGTSSVTVNTDASGVATSPAWTLGTTVGALNNTLEARNGAKAVTTLATATVRPIEITAWSSSITYPTAVSQSYTITSGGLGGSDAISSVTYRFVGTGSTTYGPSTTAPTEAGTYSVTPIAVAFSPGGASNYTITYQPGTITIAALTQTITFNPNPIPSKTYGDAPFSIAVSASSGLPVTVVSSTPTVCTVSASVVTIVGSQIGGATCSLTASQAGNASVTPAPNVTRTFAVAQAAQPTLTMSSPSGSPATAIYGQTISLAVVGGAGSGALGFAVTSPMGPGLCSVSGTTLTLGEAGSLCKVQATKLASANYLIATSLEQPITITPAGQTLAFTSTVPITPEFGGRYTPTASANSTVTGLSSGVTPSFSASGNCAIDNLTDEVTFGLPGTCTITASAASNRNFAAATNVTQVIEIGMTNQTITFTQPGNVAFGSASVAMSATTSSNGDVTFARGIGITACSVSPLGVVTILAVGTCEVIASAAVFDQYAAASNVTRAFQIVAALPTAPTLTSASAGSQSMTVGFTVPGFTGGATITGYELVATPTGGGTIVTSTACTTSPCTISGLTNGTAYTITVAAINSAGTGPASSASTPLIAATQAYAVGSLAATPGVGNVTVSWTQPTDLGGGTFVRYDLYSRVSGGSYGSATAINSIGTTSYTFSGLDNGTSYDFKIVTITLANGVEIAGGPKEVAEYAATVPTVPLTPTVLASVATDVQFSWSAPLSDGGAALGGPNYRVSVTTSTPGASAVTCTPSGTDTYCTAVGLTNDAVYTFTVEAHNRRGYSAAASVIYAVPSRIVTLSDLEVSGSAGAISLTPAFTSGTTTYTTSVPNSVATVTVTPTTTSAGATVTVGGVAVGSGSASSPIPLSLGTNSIAVVVTASDPRFSQTYTVAITRAATPGGGGGASGPADRARVPVTPPAEVFFGSRPGAVLVDGQMDSTAVFAANGTNSGWSVVDNAFALSARTESATGTPMPMTPQGVMQVPQGGIVILSGSQFAYGTDLNVFAIPLDQSSGPAFMGAASVTATGAVRGSIAVPMGMEPGSYVLQVNGVLGSNQVASVNMRLNVLPRSLSARSSMMREAAFYQGTSVQFTQAGKAKLRSMVAAIPAGAQDVEIAVVGVSVSLDTPRANLRLARDRAENIVAFLKDSGVEGTVTVSLSTSFDLQSFQRSKSLSGAEQPMTSSTGKPLTTLTMGFTTASP